MHVGSAAVIVNRFGSHQEETAGRGSFVGRFLANLPHLLREGTGLPRPLDLGFAEQRAPTHQREVDRDRGGGDDRGGLRVVRGRLLVGHLCPAAQRFDWKPEGAGQQRTLLEENVAGRERRSRIVLRESAEGFEQGPVVAIEKRAGQRPAGRGPCAADRQAARRARGSAATASRRLPSRMRPSGRRLSARRGTARTPGAPPREHPRCEGSRPGSRTSRAEAELRRASASALRTPPSPSLPHRPLRPARTALRPFVTASAAWPSLRRREPRPPSAPPEIATPGRAAALEIANGLHAAQKSPHPFDLRRRGHATASEPAPLRPEALRSPAAQSRSASPPTRLAASLPARHGTRRSSSAQCPQVRQAPRSTQAAARRDRAAP